MNIRKTIENLSTLESKSKKKGYIGDATNYAFQRHVLNLLSNQEDEEQANKIESQKTGAVRFECSHCKGTGYKDIWKSSKKNDIEDKLIQDCDSCKGEGFVIINVIDERVKSKSKLLEYRSIY